MIEDITQETERLLEQVKLLKNTEREYETLFYKARKPDTKLKYARNFEYRKGLIEGIIIGYNILNKYKDKEIDKTKFINEFLEANPWKKAWEELKINPYNWEEGLTWREYIEMLEQKHNIEVKK